MNCEILCTETLNMSNLQGALTLKYVHRDGHHQGHLLTILPKHQNIDSLPSLLPLK